MTPTLLFAYIDDETIKITYNGKGITTINHDEDGWQGMERITEALKIFADYAGIEVIDET